MAERTSEGMCVARLMTTSWPPTARHSALRSRRLTATGRRSESLKDGLAVWAVDDSSDLMAARRADRPPEHRAHLCHRLQISSSHQDMKPTPGCIASPGCVASRQTGYLTTNEPVRPDQRARTGSQALLGAPGARMQDVLEPLPPLPQLEPGPPPIDPSPPLPPSPVPT
jgi:hypothetical protein